MAISLSTVELPTGPDSLRAFAATLQTALLAKLKVQLATLWRVRFGQSSEELDRQIDLFELASSTLRGTKLKTMRAGMRLRR